MHRLFSPLFTKSRPYIQLRLLTSRVSSEKVDGMIPCVTTDFSDIHQEFQLKGELGRGATAVVRLALHRKTQEPYAVKTLSKLGMSATMLEQISHEIHILEQLRHPNIVDLHSTFEDEREVHIVTELCTGGELWKRIAIENGSLSTEKAISGLMKAMLSAVAHCHKHDICHKDLKPQNFLFKDEKKDSHLILVDFGVSAIRRSGWGWDPGFLGSPNYMAPEVMSSIIQGQKDQFIYTPSCDIWSLGVILYTMLSGELPFDGETDEEFRSNVASGEYKLDGPQWSEISPSAKEFIQRLMHVDPKQRYTAEEALEDQWITSQAEGRCYLLNLPLINSIVRFSTKDRMTRLALAVMSTTLTNEEADEMRRVFERIDKDGDQTLSVEELYEAVSELETEYPEHADRTRNLLFSMAEHSKSRGRGLNYREFLGACMLRSQFMSDEERIRAAFQQFDRTNTGIISTEDLRCVLYQSADEIVQNQCQLAPSRPHPRSLARELNITGTVEDILSEMDENNDGVINYHEFLRLLQQNCRSHSVTMVDMLKRDHPFFN